MNEIMDLDTYNEGQLLQVLAVEIPDWEEYETLIEGGDSVSSDPR